MSSFFRVMSCALLAGVLLVSASAEARFGKRSRSSEETEEESDSRVHEASPVGEDSGSSGSVHDSSPVYSSRSRPSRSYVGPRSSHSFWSESRFASRRHRNFTLGLDAQAMREGAGVGLHLGVEGELLGAFLRTSALSLAADDGSSGTDTVVVTELHVSFAALTGRAGRLRLEGGVSVAKAPDVTFVGPSVGLSSELYLLRSLSLEARVQLTPWPHRQLDAAGGVVWYLGSWRMFALRGGMRVLMLDDAGWVDGVAHRDVLPGPYVSFGLAI